MNYKIYEVTEGDKEVLASLRIAAMRESLENIGRFDPARAKDRFLSTFVSGDTRKILVDGELIGFYVLKKKEDHYYLDHLYFYPRYQGSGLGSKIISSIKELASINNISVRLGHSERADQMTFILSMVSNIRMRASGIFTMNTCMANKPINCT